jgi:hypothetical protein
MRHRLLRVVDQLLAFIWLLLVLPPIWLLPPASIELRAFSVAVLSWPVWAGGRRVGGM